jgi:CTP:molybdopterin cytidylyltransferase MocA
LHRFGSDRLLHPVNGKPLAAHIAATVAAVGIEHRLATGPVNEDRKRLFAAHAFAIIENADPGQGMAL